MPFADGTSRSVLATSLPIPLTLATGVEVKAGDPLGYNSGWVLADANAGIPARLIAGEDGKGSITAYESARVRGFTGGTPDASLYLSDTAGGYSDTPSTTSEQKLGFMISATEAVVNLHRFNEKDYVSHNFAAADIANIIFIATERVRVTKISEVHATVAGQAGTATVERLQATEAPASGDDLLNTTKIDLAGTINTVQTPALTATPANLVLETGNRLALKLASGAATSLANACITVELQRA